MKHPGIRDICDFGKSVSARNGMADDRSLAVVECEWECRNLSEISAYEATGVMLLAK
jgi:hypothetical protein